MLRKDTRARFGLIGGVVLAVAILVAAFLMMGTFTEAVPNANAPTNEFGDPAIGYLDVSASIPIDWVGSRCAPGDCQITYGAFLPKTTQHNTDGVPAPTTVFKGFGGATVVDTTCSVKVELKVYDSGNSVVATQMNPAKSVNIGVGERFDGTWGHVFFFERAIHTLQFSIYALGGGGCSSYSPTPSEPGVIVAMATINWNTADH